MNDINEKTKRTTDEYDVDRIIHDLNEKEDINPDSHDGSYQMMRETIKAYTHLHDLSIVDYRDLNLIYLTSVGTWKHGIEAKKSAIDESHIEQEDKEHLKNEWDVVWEKAGEKRYSNCYSVGSGSQSVGMFGTGFFSFQNKTTDESVYKFIKMCIDLLSMEEDDAMYNRAAQVLTLSFRGMAAASASMVLHCLKPYTFPILNSNMGSKNLYEIIGIPLIKSGNIETYIDNCRKIKAFRDKIFTCKNFRVFDIAAWDTDKYIKKPIKKTWLITWNKDKWHWDNYKQLCEETKNGGNSIVHRWACSNRNPKPNDEVYLIKLGGHPRGIIGHGIVVKKVYEQKHYDPDKAAEGKVEHCIDVRFDNLLDYEKEKYISQEELNQKCPQQHWSPQNSGIEIKTDVLPELRALWMSVIQGESSEGWELGPPKYDPGLSPQDYHDLFLNEKVVTHDWLISLYELYKMPDHAATCKQLGLRYGYEPSHYISHIPSTAESIMKATGCKRPPEEKNAKRWPVLCVGRYVSEGYCWKLREPVTEAIEMLIKEGKLIEQEDKQEMIQFDHNIILYGPPGTGKTYSTAVYAVAVIEKKPLAMIRNEDYEDVLKRFNEYKEQGRVVSTTFHQSYGYEDFMEGIKPVMETDEENAGDVRYEISSGVFKQFCERAAYSVSQTESDWGINASPKIWKVSLGGTHDNPTREECLKNGHIRINWDEYGPEIDDKTEYSNGGKYALYCFVSGIKVGDIVLSCYTNTTIDAIGVVTGDYEWHDEYPEYKRLRKVRWLAKDIREDILGKH